jgi:hypothetical protein
MNSTPQQPPLTDDMILSHDLIQGLRPHAVSQGRLVFKLLLQGVVE